nr:putative reverse transcriptase domain-containing protein [Tanacetum cinerariifolium]
MPPRRSECEELKCPFFEGDGSSFDEWRDYGVAGDDYEGPPIFDDDQFKDELEMGDDAFVLIGKDVASNSEIPKAMFHLLEEFFDVFHDELPDALPPLCAIQHHIDLEPSSQLPNRPYYILSPGEHEELRRQDFVAGLHDVHKVVRDNLVRANSKYKQDVDQKRRHVDFEVGDFVWAVLTKDRFPVGEYNKLSAKKIGLLEIVEKMNSNAYRLKLPSHIRCSDVFNVKHLLPYHGNSSDEDSVGNSRTNFVYPGENDVNPCIEERADLFLEALDRVRKKGVY